MNRNFRKSLLATTITLVVGVNSAQATISNGAPSVQAGGVGVSGELFISIWDQAASTSYVLDLGTTVDNFVANSATSRSWALDQTFVNWSSITNDPLTFNVAGNNEYHPQSDGQWGVVMSRRTGASKPGAIALNALGTYGLRITGHVNFINTDEGIPILDTNFSQNLSLVTTNVKSGAYFNDPFWGTAEGINGWVGSAVVRNGTIADQTVDMFNIHLPVGEPLTSTHAIFDKLDGYLALDVANAQVLWHSNVAPVPLPSATWLFLTGLIGVFKIQKSRSKTAV